MLSKKNTRLSILLLFLLVAAILLGIFSKPKNSSLSIDQHLFSIADTANISQIQIERKGEIQLLSKGLNGWSVNDKYQLDEYLRTVLFAVINRVEIKRPVPKNQAEEIKNALLTKGVKVKVLSSESSSSFYAGGNQNQTVSYLMNVNDETPYIVNIPGYTSYVAGIFDLSENDWRDKKITRSHWTSIQKIEINYTENNSHNFEIEFDKSILRLANTDDYDTTAVMNYVQIYQSLAVDAFFDKGQNPLVDSLLTSSPIAKLKLIDLDPEKNIEMSIFSQVPDLNYFPVLINNKQEATINSSRIKELLRQRNDFK